MRKLKSSSGETLLKRMHVKVFYPGNEKRAQFIFRSPAGKGMSWDNVNANLRSIADKIEKQWPSEEYAMVPTGADSYNFVWLRAKDLSA